MLAPHLQLTQQVPAGRLGLCEGDAVLVLTFLRRRGNVDCLCYKRLTRNLWGAKWCESPLASLSGNQPVAHLKRALCFLACPIAALLVRRLSPGPFQLAQRTFILRSPDLAQAVGLSSRPYRVPLGDPECLMSTTVPKCFSLKTLCSTKSAAAQRHCGL